MKLGFRPDEAADAVGGSDILARMKAAGWVKPLIEGHRCTVYDGADLARAWTLLKNAKGALPPLPRKAKPATA